VSSDSSPGSPVIPAEDTDMGAAAAVLCSSPQSTLLTGSVVRYKDNGALVSH
jgi:hypothetical protein